MHVFGKDSSCSLFMWEVSWIFNSQKFVYLTQIDYQVWNRCQYMKESFLERMIQKSLWIQRRGMSKSVSPSDIFFMSLIANERFPSKNDFTEQWTSDFTEQTISLNKRFHCKQTISLNKRFHWTNDFTGQMISLNKRFYWRNDFSERTISLNKLFNWTNDFTEQMISLQTNNFSERTISLNERFLWTKDVT